MQTSAASHFPNLTGSGLRNNVSYCAESILRSVLATGLSLLLAAGVTAAESKKPNIILILADDMGYGDIGCFGQAQLKTPRLDEMASSGMRLTQFYAGCTVCAPSRSVLMTGHHVGRTPVRGNSTDPIVIQPGTETIASMLKQAGYKTACIGKWGIGTPDNLTNPNDVGFDHFYGYVDMWHAHNFFPEFLIRNGQVEKLENRVADKWREWQSPGTPKGGRGVAAVRRQYAPDLFVDEALRFIRENHATPFFLYFAMNVPHANNEAGKQGMEVPSLGEFSEKQWPAPEKGFGAMIRNIDRDTGRIIDLLNELDLDQNTLVLFTSDNGPHQEGGHDADYFNSNSLYRGIKRDLYEGGIRVPAIAWWPGTISPGSRNRQPWYFADLLATTAELAGLSPPSDTDGQSFAAALTNETEGDPWEREKPLYWEFYERGSAQAVRIGRWKAIRSPMFSGPVELYDLQEDASEQRDVAGQHPDLVREAEMLMEKMHRPDPNWSIRP